MTKSILIPLIFLLTLSAVMAQQTDANKIRHSVMGDVPMVVLAALGSDNPGMNIHEHVPPSMISKEDLRKQMKTYNVPAYYAIIKGKDYRKTSAYSKEGKLISSTERIKNTAVPRAVLTTIGREYNGWSVTRNLMTKIIAGTYNSVTYEVWIKNGRKKQRLTMNETGMILSKKRPEY